MTPPLALFSFLLVGLIGFAYGDEAASASVSESEAWEAQGKDSIGGALVWDTEKRTAVMYFNVGADSYHYYYWCFRKDDQGKMQPIAVFSTQSDFLHPLDVRISQSGINVALSDGNSIYYTQFFSFISQRANIEIWKNMEDSEIFYSMPMYEELMLLKK